MYVYQLADSTAIVTLGSSLFDLLQSPSFRLASYNSRFSEIITHILVPSISIACAPVVLLCSLAQLSFSFSCHRRLPALLSLMPMVPRSNLTLAPAAVIDRRTSRPAPRWSLTLIRHYCHLRHSLACDEMPICSSFLLFAAHLPSNLVVHLSLRAVPLDIIL